MGRKILGRGSVLGLALALAVATTAWAATTPTISITKPAKGAVISRSQTPKMKVTGKVSFLKTVPTTFTEYLQRDACNNTVAMMTDILYLTLSEAGEFASSCAVDPVWTGTNDVFQITEDYVATDGRPTPSDTDGLPFTLDATKNITGQITTAAFLGMGAAGQLTIEVTVSGTVGGTAGTTLGHFSQTVMVDPTGGDIVTPFEITPDAALNNKEVSALTLTLYMHGPSLMQGFTTYNGASFVSVPGFKTPPAGAVQVSVDNSGFTKPLKAKLNATKTAWSLSITTPKVGNHTIYARAVQGDQIVTADPHAFKVTA